MKKSYPEKCPCIILSKLLDAIILKKSIGLRVFLAGRILLNGRIKPKSVQLLLTTLNFLSSFIILTNQKQNITPCNFCESFFHQEECSLKISSQKAAWISVRKVRYRCPNAISHISIVVFQNCHSYFIPSKRKNL